MPEESVEIREYAAHPLLAPFVKSVWSMESPRAHHEALRERILPDGCVELVIHFRAPFRGRFADGDHAIQPRSFLVGQMTRFLEIESTGRVGFVAIRFHARSAYLFFPKALRAIASEVVAVPDVLVRPLADCSERVALAKGMAARVGILQQGLLEALRANGRTDRAVDRCLELIEIAPGEATISSLACRIGLSERQLRRRFEDAVGLSPKTFARIRRFNQALDHLRARRGSRTETALACGYFDQAHFNHDFREFADMTPGELLASSTVAA